MELKDLPKEKISKDEIDATQKQDLFNAIVRGKDLTEIVHTSRGDFEIKFPRIRDLQAIGRLTALRQNGIPATAFDFGTYALMQHVASLDVLVIKGPSWFENAKKENNNGFSWAEIPSQEFVEEVYAKAYEFRQKIQAIFDSDSQSTDKDVVNNANTDASNEPGLFDNMSGSK